MSELGTRQKEYENSYDTTIIKRLPIIIRVDGRNFSRVTRKAEKPLDPKVAHLMQTSMLESAKDIDGCIFAYTQSDECSFILRNDQSYESQPWFANRVQKIVSIAASTFTYEFNKALNELDEKPLLTGKMVFDARVFAVPSINEVVNNLIFRQRDCIKNAITNATRSELIKRLGRKTCDKILEGKNQTERLFLLKDECKINYEEYYEASFRRGVATYKVPSIYETKNGTVFRQKWTLDKNLPVFSESKEFITSILSVGKGIYKPESDINVIGNK